MRKGFTLIEAIIGICLLGLVAVTVIPIINSAFAGFYKQRIKAEMIYVGESTIEKIKSYNVDKSSDIYIYDTNVSEIIDLFRLADTVEINLPKDKNNGEYLIDIIKEQKSSKLWTISVEVSEQKEGSSINHATYKAYLPQK